MEIKKGKTFGFFLVLFLISLFLIFFVGRNNNGFFLTTNGVSHFKKGMDIAGGIKLTYKIDFSKYKKIYTDKRKFAQIKDKVEDIILQNIDSRISTLGVSDYSSYIQTINESDYVVVELGGIKDKEKAKEVIGKTVALEFKVPYEGEKEGKVIERRKTIANDLFSQVKDSPELISELGTGRTSENISYNSYSQKELFRLPVVYQENIEKFENLEKGEVYPEVLSGVYGRSYIRSGQNLVPKTLEGWTIVKLNGKEQRVTEKVEEKKVKRVSQNFGLEVEESYTSDSNGISAKEFQYFSGENKIIYNGGEMFSGEKAFDAKIYKINKPNLIGKSQQEIQQIKQSKQSVVEEVKSSLEAGENVSSTGVQLVNEGWMNKQSIESEVEKFDLTGSNIKSYENQDSYYVVKTTDVKDTGKQIYKKLHISGVSSENVDEIKKQLKTKEYYSFEDIFIEKTPQWITAKDPKSGRILNGAYFEFASVNQSQAGKSVVTVQFNSEGKSIFCNLTEQYQGKKMAIFVGGELTTAPVIGEKICGGAAQIDGNFATPSEAKELANELNEGAFPAKLILSQEEKVSPLLGERALGSSIKAGVVGLLVIAVFVMFFWGLYNGIVATVSLLMFLTILFGLTKLTGYAFSLSSIAAIILSIGMSVDSNILIFERIREEREGGKSIKQAVIDGYSRSISAIRDGKLTTFMIALILFMLGMNIFKGFGFMMIINILLTLALVPLTFVLVSYLFATVQKK